MNGRQRYWFFTENNPEGELNLFFEEEYKKGVLQWAKWQLECGDNGNEHHQGVIAFYKQEYFNKVCKWFGPRVHIEVVRDLTAARNYVCKDEIRIDGPWTIGEIKEGGTKSSWTEISEAFRSGLSYREVALANPSYVGMWDNGLRRLDLLFSKSRDFKSKVVLIIGPSDTGKTHYVNQFDPDYYPKGASHKWWDGYYGQKTVFIDEFYGQLEFPYMLTLLDKWKCLAETKGGFVNLAPTTIFIGSNSYPRTWWTLNNYRNMNSQPLLEE